MLDITNSPLWPKRYKLFSKFDEWIQYDDIGFHSTKPEEISRKLWNIVVWNVVFDWFCWLWSNAIWFALAGKKVITCDTNANRLQMAKNNAKVYGVEERITFIHGSVLDHISTLEYDIAYFDPPWSTDWMYYFDKWKFKFSDYGVDGMELIRCAKRKTENIIFALPKNFDFSELSALERKYVITREVVDMELFLYTLFLDPHNNFWADTDSIVRLEEIDEIIFNAFINISHDLTDYKVRKIVYHNTLNYLRNALLRTPESKHFLIYNGYGADMERIIAFCQKEIVENENFVLSEDIIKNLHKTLYPDGYIQKKKDNLGKEFVWMIPGELRTINLSSMDNTNKEIYAKFSDVKSLLESLIRSYNLSWNKEEAILYFLADFSRVHPFGDGNGRVNYLLADLLLLKMGQEPLWLGKKEGSERLRLHAILDVVHETRNLEPLYGFIQESTSK